MSSSSPAARVYAGADASEDLAGMIEMREIREMAVVVPNNDGFSSC
jgi:hypothetical protein